MTLPGWATQRSVGELVTGYVRARTAAMNPGFQAEYEAGLAAFSRRFGILGPFLSAAREAHLALGGVPAGAVLFRGTRFLNLARQIADRTCAVVLAAGKTEWRKARNAGLQTCLDAPLVLQVSRILRMDPAQREPAWRSAVATAEDLLERMQPRCIVVSNDSTYPDRVWALAAKGAGIPCLVIQDGWFQSGMPPCVWHGHFADHVLCWGEHTRGLFVAHQVAPADRISILGYPFPVRPCQPPTQPSTLCVVGGNWESYGPELANAKAQWLGVLRRAGEQAGWRVVYRPHPGERLDENASGAQPYCGMEVANESLEEAFLRYGLFAGAASTVLLEAALCGRPALHVSGPAWPEEPLEPYGAAATLPAKEEVIREWLAQTLAQGAPVRPVPDSAIHIETDPATALEAAAARASGQPPRIPAP